MFNTCEISKLPIIIVAKVNKTFVQGFICERIAVTATVLKIRFAIIEIIATSTSHLNEILKFFHIEWEVWNHEIEDDLYVLNINENWYSTYIWIKIISYISLKVLSFYFGINRKWFSIINMTTHRIWYINEVIKDFFYEWKF